MWNKTYIHVTEKIWSQEIFLKNEILWMNSGEDRKFAARRHLNLGHVAYQYDTAEETAEIF
jgi:hypothetical protein